MDWLNANLYRELGYNLVYPQLFPHHARQSEEGTRATIAWGSEKTRHWLGILDKHFIGDSSDYICLDRLTLADYLASGQVGLAEAVSFDFSEFPNVDRWLRNMKTLASWDKVNGGFYQMISAMAA